MEVIFLDIDGVLNSVSSMIAFHALKTETDYRTNEDRLDTVAIGLLKRACEVTNAKLVISSTWRMGREVKDFISLFEKYGWKDAPVISKTVIGYHMFEIGKRTRGHEIQYWLDTCENTVDNYVILDDDSDMLDTQLDNFVHVSNINGFTASHYCKTVRLLGAPDTSLESQVNFKRKPKY